MKTIAERFGIHTITQNNLARITPAIAAEMLRMNDINRNMRPSHIKYIERQINLGNWIVTHQGIAFSKSGLLIDGQHRLMAIVNSGKTVYMYVFEGLPDEAYKAIDVGHVARTIPDITGLNKFSVSILRAYNQFFTGATGSGGLRMSTQEVEQMYNDKQVHIDAITKAQSHEKYFNRSYIWAGILRYSEQSHEKAMEFAGAIIDPATDIIQARLFRDYLLKKGINSPVVTVLETLMYCMDAHYKNKHIKPITGRNRLSVQEAFA